MKKIFLFCLALMVLTVGVNAQKIKWDNDAKLDFLKEEKELKVSYDYSQITVAEGSEQAFLDEKKQTINEDKPGKGDEFVERWNRYKAENYPKHFEEIFNKEMRKESFVASQNAASKYELVIRTKNIDLGKGKAFGTQPARVDYELEFIEIATKTVVAKGTMTDVRGEVKAPAGTGFVPGGAGRAIRGVAAITNLDALSRVSEAYEVAAIALAKVIRKVK